MVGKAVGRKTGVIAGRVCTPIPAASPSQRWAQTHRERNQQQQVREAQ